MLPIEYSASFLMSSTLSLKPATMYFVRPLSINAKQSAEELHMMLLVIHIAKPLILELPFSKSYFISSRKGAWLTNSLQLLGSSHIIWPNISKLWSFSSVLLLTITLVLEMENLFIKSSTIKWSPKGCARSSCLVLAASLDQIVCKIEIISIETLSVSSQEQDNDCYSIIL